jgi:hypothetical protein
MNAIVNDTIAMVKSAQVAPDDLLMKNFTQTSTATQGFQLYNLEAPSKKLYPILTPLRNIIPRVSGGFGVQANWKAVTGVNTTGLRMGLAEGARSGVISQNLVEYLAAFRGQGLENNVSYEANFAAQGFEDLKALAVTQLLQSVMVGEELLDLFGNTSLSMGTTPTPTTATATTGGTIAAGTYSVICVALGGMAYNLVAGWNNGNTGQTFNATTAIVPGAVTRTNADGTTTTFGGNNAQQSASASQTTTGSTSTISATVTAVNGAVAYAWFVGASGSERIAALTTINSVVLTSIPSSGQLASAIPGGAADQSTSTLDYDGLFTQAFKSGSNAQIITQATGTAGTGTGLTADNAGGVYEFEQMFAQFYNKYRFSPTHIFVNSQELINITKKVVQGSGAPLLQLIDQASDSTIIRAGAKVGSYLNKITGDVLPVIVHPNVPPGTVFFYSAHIPYPLENTPALVRKLLRMDYYQIDWPITKRRYDYGVYFDGVLQHYAPFSMGLITNIGNA